jgi:hypothetical protein
MKLYQIAALPDGTQHPRVNCDLDEFSPAAAVPVPAALRNLDEASVSEVS